MSNIKLLSYAKRKYSMLGTKSTVLSGTERVGLPKTSGKGLEYLKIEGGTPNGVSLGDSGIRVRLASRNLINVDKLVELILSYDTNANLVEVDGRRCIKYKNSSTFQKDLTVCCPKFKENTRYIFSLEAKPYEIMSESSQYNGELFVSFKPKDTSVTTPSGLNAKSTRDFTRIYSVVKPDSTVTDISLSWGSAWNWLIDLDSVYLYEYDGDNSPSYDPPLVSEVIIPAKITQDDGTELVLSLGENEELVYERERLTYKKGQDVYDFSGTELHKALKSLKTVYDTDFTLEIKGEGTPLSITASYYSTQNQDERALTVSYLCSGKEILDTRTYAVRKDSIYKIIPPYIKGYKPQCKEQHGIITEDTNIILSYSKE